MKKYLRYTMVAISLFLIVSMGRSTISFLGKGSAIDEAQQTVKELEEEQARLLQTKSTVETQEFIEKEARDRLGLAKPGDVTIILPPDEVLKKYAPSFEEEVRIEELPIYKRWVRMFFKF